MAPKINFYIDSDSLAHRWIEKFNQQISELQRSETEDFKDEIESQWVRYEERNIRNIERVTGLSVEGEFHIAVLHPDLDEAQYLDTSHIEWGHKEMQQNGILIGISHEIIHCLTHEFYSGLSDDEKWLFHAIVYLSADEELRFELNGKSEYFDSPIVNSFYHERLISTAKRLLPLWKERMLCNPRRDVISFFKELPSQI